MVTALDLGVALLVLVSALFAMVRGFTREVLALLSWALAAGITVIAAGYPGYLGFFTEIVGHDLAGLLVMVVTTFFGVVLLLTLITWRIGNMVSESRIGALDRSAAFIFGALRGIVLASIALFCVDIFIPEVKNQPVWISQSKVRPLLEVVMDGFSETVIMPLGDYVSRSVNGTGDAVPQGGVEG